MRLIDNWFNNGCADAGMCQGRLLRTTSGSIDFTHVMTLFDWTSLTWIPSLHFAICMIDIYLFFVSQKKCNERPMPWRIQFFFPFCDVDCAPLFCKSIDHVTAAQPTRIWNSILNGRNETTRSKCMGVSDSTINGNDHGFGCFIFVFFILLLRCCCVLSSA